MENCTNLRHGDYILLLHGRPGETRAFFILVL